ncbi:hypothetical protein O1L68_43735 [Streptomyces lydicus]|nr:hypothetical protein [Streptomyces lydicus]
MGKGEPDDGRAEGTVPREIRSTLLRQNWVSKSVTARPTSRRSFAGAGGSTWSLRHRATTAAGDVRRRRRRDFLRAYRKTRLDLEELQQQGKAQPVHPGLVPEAHNRIKQPRCPARLPSDGHRIALV